MLEGTSAIAIGQSTLTNLDLESGKWARAKVVEPTVSVSNAANSRYTDEAASKAKEMAQTLREDVIKAIETANNKFESYNTRAEYSIHEKTNEIMIKIYKGDELVKEIPPEKMLDMVAKMLEFAGLLFDEKA